MSDKIIRLPDDETDGDEGWERATDEPDLRNVEAHKSEDGGWQVTVWVAEFVREDPLERELREGIASALRAVPGVAAVAEEDREVWEVRGEPSGEALLLAAATVVDALADRARTYLDS